MPPCERTSRPRVCVIGAGASGLAVTKALRCLNIDVVVFEQGAGIGGLWRFDPLPGSHSGAYQSLRASTRKSTMEFSDFPISQDFPEYPTSHQVLTYLEEYARHFSLYPSIRFSTRVLQIIPHLDGSWSVIIQSVDGTVTTECFTAVAVCNGAFWSPQLPDISGMGQFTGRMLHSHDYKTAESFVGKRVLVVGMGMSGTEISVELAAAGATVIASTNRQTTIADQRLAPQTSLAVRAAVTQLTSSGALFADGSAADFDAIIFCTGYRVSFPFLSKDLELKVTRGTPYVHLWKHMWAPRLDNIAFIGFVTTHGSIFPLVEAQAQWFASVAAGETTLPPGGEMESEVEEWQELLKELSISYKHTEVTAYAYRAEIYRQLGLLSDLRYKEFAKYL